MATDFVDETNLNVVNVSSKMSEELSLDLASASAVDCVL